ncbi:GNAT family N-acetyltransferase [Ureibacillus sp. GCM10028918]|uniref:GNAT family N-acetyltransferase n=1 Tax=Ureibacillus sp. GCM10028918 TaxID=3273429 RepID=UPI00361B27BC
MTLVLNNELAEKLNQSEMDALRSRLTAIQQIQGNPMGVEIQKFGQATAFSVQNIPGPAFNTVKGLKAGDEPYIEQILAFYKQKEIPARFELTPAAASSELLTCLSEAGYYQHDFYTTLYTSLSKVNIETSNPPKLSIRKLEGREFDIFAHIYVKGFGMPEFLKSGVAQNNEVLYDNGHWTFYLAAYKGEAAGIGVLFMKDSIATLAAAATVPSIRNKGIQSELIKHRIGEAIEKECNLIVGQAKFGTVSHNNMERAGLQVAYTKAIWIAK